MWKIRIDKGGPVPTPRVENVPKSFLARSKKFIKEHALSLVILTFFVIQSLLTLFLGYRVWESDQADHGNKLITDDFWTWWSYEYHISIVADVFGALLLVVLTKHLREKHSQEGR